MNFKKIMALTLASVMLFSIALTGCTPKESPPTANSNYETSASESEASGYVPELISSPNANPAVIANFGDDYEYTTRGDITTEIVEADEAGNMACKMSNRPENWMGICFSCEEFVGNTINVETRVMSDGGVPRISLMYDSYGSTTYVNLFDVMDCDNEYKVGIGQIDVPVGVNNVYIYIEALDTADIYADYMYITCEGTYIVPDGDVVALADYSEYESLAELYADYFLMGVAIPASMVENEELMGFVTHEWNSITLENELKPENILDGTTTLADPETYNECPAFNFENVAPALDYAEANGLKVRGHVLIWHSQTPDWLFYEDYDINGELASRELMLTRMENYIKTVLTYMEENYPGLFYAYDVVNEAIGDDNHLRDSFWVETIGEDFIYKAFEFADMYAGEGVDLFYNDYNEYVPAKKATILEYIQPIADAGYLDGFGMQSHINTGITAQEYCEVLKDYADTLGVKIHVTELDIKQSSVSLNAEYDQGVYYQSLFEELIAAKDEGYPIESVTVWGISDTKSWRASELPLLFHGDLTPKLAFTGVVCAITGDEIPLPADYVAPLGAGDPIIEDFEGDSFYGGPRYSAILTVVSDEAYEGSNSLEVSGGVAEYDGFSIDVTRFLGTTIHYSFAIKSDCEEMHFVADIDGEWPWLEQIDTTSGEWIVVEGTYEVPSDFTSLSLYFESLDMSSFYIDSIVIEEA